MLHISVAIHCLAVLALETRNGSYAIKMAVTYIQRQMKLFNVNHYKKDSN